MPVQIYNTLTKKKEDLPEGNINMYTCGVTVYDVCHIGHARSLYIFDVIRRYLEYRGRKVDFVRNITDIDDKIINKARELGKTAQQVAEDNIASYREDLKSLGIEGIEHEPRATENIPEMIRHIQGLIEKGFAYEVSGDVYFSVRKFPDYGKLSGQSIEQMQEAVRIEKDAKKKDPLDFALWKKSKEDEPFWESPWGKGRPGWHIECSVMSSKFLKTETLDIHGGGRDLIFPHHENEIAQSEALTGKPFAKIWIHHGLLTINGQKMAKSLGNFVTISDFKSKYNDMDLLKLFFLSAQYSQPIDYNEKSIKEAREQQERIFSLLLRIQKSLSNAKIRFSSSNIPEIEDIKNKFMEAMDDDFNYRTGMAQLFNLVNIANKNINDLNFVVKSYNLLLDLADLLGLELRTKTTKWIFTLPPEIESLKQKRIEAKKLKDFSGADKIRKEIERLGYSVGDNKDGTTEVWKKL
ncbi:MAG: cysteine--tRNA ligase [Candidatus Omnitrophica bacterium]|nr:cysteine--tRNA ligase [Candidatus Omnitrophota bacterium]